MFVDYETEISRREQELNTLRHKARLREVEKSMITIHGPKGTPTKQIVCPGCKKVVLAYKEHYHTIPEGYKKACLPYTNDYHFGYNINGGPSVCTYCRKTKPNCVVDGCSNKGISSKQVCSFSDYRYTNYFCTDHFWMKEMKYDDIQDESDVLVVIDQIQVSYEDWDCDGWGGNEKTIIKYQPSYRCRYFKLSKSMCETMSNYVDSFGAIDICNDVFTQFRNIYGMCKVVHSFIINPKEFIPKKNIELPSSYLTDGDVEDDYDVESLVEMSIMMDQLIHIINTGDGFSFDGWYNHGPRKAVADKNAKRYLLFKDALDTVTECVDKLTRKREINKLQFSINEVQAKYDKTMTEANKLKAKLDALVLEINKLK